MTLLLTACGRANDADNVDSGITGGEDAVEAEAVRTLTVDNWDGGADVETGTVQWVSKESNTGTFVSYNKIGQHIDQSEERWSIT